jgi:TM2 domain-containing membrane protein YozV
MRFVIGTIIGLVALSAIVGLAVTVDAVRSARSERRRREGRPSTGLSLRARVGRYVGPIDPSTAVLNPPGRVATEFIGALCGFPGLGWIFSGCIFTGIVLLSLGPAVIWGFFPVILSVTGKLSSGPFVAVQYLPGLALGSAMALAYREIRLARRRRLKADPPHPA